MEDALFFSARNSEEWFSQMVVEDVTLSLSQEYSYTVHVNMTLMKCDFQLFVFNVHD